MGGQRAKVTVPADSPDRGASPANRTGISAAPRVSVITIFHNAEAYLREAVESVLIQDFEDYELLLVDDGSTDTSSSIALEYERRDRRVRYLKHSGHANRGMSATRNLGLSKARGEFVAFIDSDDRWRKHKLSEQLDLLDKMPEIDAVSGSVLYWKSHAGGTDRVVPTAHVRNRPILPGEASVKVYPLGRANAPSMSDLLFRRSSIAKVGGFEEAFAGAYEDQAFLSKFYLESAIFVTRSRWSDYRIHPASCMAKVSRDNSYDAIRRAFLDWFEGYLASHRLRDDQRILRALDRAWRRYPPRQKKKGGVRRAIRRHAPEILVRAVRTAKAARDRLRPIFNPGPSILMYHRIADESFDPWGMAVSPSHFAEQLDWLARHRTILPLAEFAQLNRREKLPQNALAITFDDGYACNGLIAVPLLESSAAPATIFLPPALIERGREFWWDELRNIVWNARSPYLRLKAQTVSIGEAEAGDDVWGFGEPPHTARQRAYHRLWSILYSLTPAEIDSSMDELRRQAGMTMVPRAPHRLLAPSEIRDLRSALIDFGSHGLSHPSLPLLTEEEKAHEINDGKQRCEELSGGECRTFAYPYGNMDEESRRLVEAAGFECACKADGWFVRRKADLYALPRIHVGNWNAAELARLLGRG